MRSHVYEEHTNIEPDNIDNTPAETVNELLRSGIETAVCKILGIMLVLGEVSTLSSTALYSSISDGLNTLNAFDISATTNLLLQQTVNQFHTQYFAHITSLHRSVSTQAPQILDDFPAINEKILENIGFPEELVFKEGLCELTMRLIDNPVYDTVTQKRVDEHSIKKCLLAKPENPFNRDEIPLNAFDAFYTEDVLLKCKITLFVKLAVLHIEEINKLSDEKAQQQYVQLHMIDWINGHLDHIANVTDPDNANRLRKRTEQLVSVINRKMPDKLALVPYQPSWFKQYNREISQATRNTMSASSFSFTDATDSDDEEPLMRSLSFMK